MTCQTQTLTKRLLNTAREISARGDIEQAERVYRKTLDIASMEAGANSGLVGIALIEFFSFYEDQGKEEEAGAIWNLVRDLLMYHYPELMDTRKN
ncbi:MAG: hypothetical protein R3D26_18455 [Cyanobacteriota/Melainabacteria group bacterium]